MASGAAPGTPGRSFGVGCPYTSSTVHLLPSPRSGGEGPGGAARVAFARPGRLAGGSYLVDSASSHMLVSKIKPCMSKYKHFVL
jgi:hypothetical protein